MALELLEVKFLSRLLLARKLLKVKNIDKQQGFKLALELESLHLNFSPLYLLKLPQL